MKINKGDLYIDHSISGNTIWFADLDIESEDLIIVASAGSDLWKELFPFIKLEDASVKAKDHLKKQRQIWLENSFSKMKKQAVDIKDDLLIDLANIISKLKNN